VFVTRPRPGALIFSPKRRLHVIDVLHKLLDKFISAIAL